MINNIITLIRFFKQNFFLDKNEKEFINFNKLKWIKPVREERKKTSIILVDLFPWYPLIYFWSYIANILSHKYNSQLKYFYFNLSETRFSKFSFFISKLVDIYKSFNVTRGITEYDFVYRQKEIKQFEKNFSKIKTKNELIKYKKNKIKIGDLIYDTYLRTTFNPTLNLKDKRLKVIFIKAEKIFSEINTFFKKNKVKCIIPSHLCYIPYGIISRIAVSKNIPVIKVRAALASRSIRLIKIGKYCLDEAPYYSFKKIFNKFSKLEKIKNLEIGKNIILNRISGKKDKYLKYLNKSLFYTPSNRNNLFNDSDKEKIILFPHCFYDYPHRFRWMIFNDFYEQMTYFLQKSLQLKQYQWFYKPHPHSLTGHIDYHKKILKNYPNVVYLDKDTSHKSIIEMKPKCIITNHGTVAHEYAYFNIPAIHTGDNPHINYQFCITVKTKIKLNFIMNNLDSYLKNFKIEKKEIFEYLFMQYSYYANENNENGLIKDRYFANLNQELNNSSDILNYLIKKDKANNKNIVKYIQLFIKNNF
jgi:hypothetical protein